MDVASGLLLCVTIMEHIMLNFSPNDTPYKGYVYTTSDPKKDGHLSSRIPHFHDASLFLMTMGKLISFMVPDSCVN